MSLEEKVKQNYPIIKRIKRLDCGVVAEVRKPESGTPEWMNAMASQIGAYVWDNWQEVVYSLYFFREDNERFCLDGILRTVQSEKSFNMSTSTLSTSDIFGKFTRFDFDVLTLSGQSNKVEVIFKIDDSSPSKNINTNFNELDLQGHQFYIGATPKKVENYFSINAEAGIDGY
jgi:hypothetical protein